MGELGLGAAQLKEAESSGIWEGMSNSVFSASDVRDKKKKGRKRREWQSKEKEESQGSSSEGDADQASLNDGQTGQRFGKSMESLE